MEFRLLGPVEASAEGRPVGLGHPKQRTVAAVLLCELGRAVPAERLIDRVWGEDPPGSVRNILYGYIGRLRTALADCGVPGVRLTRRSGGYLLEADPERVDLHRFHRLTAAARDRDDRVALLRQALELWRGDALSGLTGAWAEATRARLADERLTARLELYDVSLGLRLVECRAHHTLATLCRALGDPERASRHASRARRIRTGTGYRPARLG